MMQTTRIESLLRELKLPIPAGVQTATENRDKGPDPAEVASQVRARLAKGGAGDTFDLASSQVPRGLQDDLRRLVEVAVINSARDLLELKRTATLALFGEFRALGAGIPTTAEAALYAGPELQAKFKQRQQQAEGYGQLYRLHQLLYDATGIGASWTEVIHRRHRARDLTRLWPRGYIITGTETPSKDPSVRKIDLMSKIQVTANQGRLELDPDLHLADRFAVQLQAINATPTASGRLSFAAPQAIHDDLVTAVSLGLYSRVIGVKAPPRLYKIDQPAPRAIDPLNPG